jgi:hypothetical protein
VSTFYALKIDRIIKFKTQLFHILINLLNMKMDQHMMVKINYINIIYILFNNAKKIIIFY